MDTAGRESHDALSAGFERRGSALRDIADLTKRAEASSDDPLLRALTRRVRVIAHSALSIGPHRTRDREGGVKSLDRSDTVG